VFDYDATGFGEITATLANAIGDGILAKGRARLGFTSTIEVSAADLMTAGGVGADLTMVEGGRQSFRAHGIYDDLQWLDGRTYLDVLIGQSTHTDGSGIIRLDPVGKVAETAEPRPETDAQPVVRADAGDADDREHGAHVPELRQQVVHPVEAAAVADDPGHPTEQKRAAPGHALDGDEQRHEEDPVEVELPDADVAEKPERPGKHRKQPALHRQSLTRAP
jgi:hypothetical protein